MSDLQRFHVLVKGRVQGVGFRYFSQNCALKLQITGWVRNLADGRVEAEIQGESAQVQLMLSELQQGPRFGHVDSLIKNEIAVSPDEKDFSVRY